MKTSLESELWFFMDDILEQNCFYGEVFRTLPIVHMEFLWDMNQINESFTTSSVTVLFFGSNLSLFVSRKVDT